MLKYDFEFHWLYMDCMSLALLLRPTMHRGFHIHNDVCKLWIVDKYYYVDVIRGFQIMYTATH